MSPSARVARRVGRLLRTYLDCSKPTSHGNRPQELDTCGLPLDYRGGVFLDSPTQELYLVGDTGNGVYGNRIIRFLSIQHQFFLWMWLFLPFDYLVSGLRPFSFHNPMGLVATDYVVNYPNTALAYDLHSSPRFSLRKTRLAVG